MASEKTTDAVALNIDPEQQPEDTTNNDDDENQDVENQPEEEQKEQPPEFLTVEHMRLCKNAFDRLCKEHSSAIGKALSKRQRDQEKLRGIHLAYSEISKFIQFQTSKKKQNTQYNSNPLPLFQFPKLFRTCLFKGFESFAIVLKKIQSKHDGFDDADETPKIFYDLGSGTSKPVFAAAMLYNFKRCTGIEILDLLHNGAREIADKWDRSKDGLLFLQEEQR